MSTNDTRFIPINLCDFNMLNFSINILYNITPITLNDYFSNKFKLGVDGILIKQNNKTGYFLPRIANNYNYDKQTLLEQLCITKIGKTIKECFRSYNTKLYYNEGFEFTL